LDANQFTRARWYPIDVTATPTKVHPQVAAIGPAQARKRLSERREANLQNGIVFVARHEHAGAPHAASLLRARRERPCCRATERSDEFAS
jgi:hypothetical protein